MRIVCRALWTILVQGCQFWLHEFPNALVLCGKGGWAGGVGPIWKGAEVVEITVLDLAVSTSDERF